MLWPSALSLGPLSLRHAVLPTLSHPGLAAQVHKLRVSEGDRKAKLDSNLRTFLAGSARLGKVASLLVNARVTPEQTWPPVPILCPSQLCRFRQWLCLSKPHSPLLQHGDNTTTSGSWES